MQVYKTPLLVAKEIKKKHSELIKQKNHLRYLSSINTIV